MELSVLVLDTNMLLGYLEMLQRFVAEVEGMELPLVVIVPGAVIYELDG